MKKVIATTLVLLMCLLSTVNCFAASFWDDASILSPYYVGTETHNETFTINSSGMVTMKGSLVPLTSTAIDEVKMTLTIKNASGTSVYNKTCDATWNSVTEAYSVTKNHQLTTKGIYTFQVTYKCYKNSSLIETIISDTISKTY